MSWDYIIDAVGNPTFIVDLLNAANNRTYGYQDYQYFLTQGDGPWGTLAWAYDKIGNRLTESRDSAIADAYSYVPNLAGNNSPQLDQITVGIGGVHDFSYDVIGDQTQADLAGNVIDRAYNQAGRMGRQERVAAEASTEFLYDGRGFLRRSEGRQPYPVGVAVFCDGFESGDTSGWGAGGSTCLETLITEPVYSSEGLLHSNGDATVLYFAGRPVAQLGDDLQYLTTDHLGTSIALSGSSVDWDGGLEPFGKDYANASSAGVFLRFPGQWEDGSWEGSSDGTEMLHNLHRWYLPGVGRYDRLDPELGSFGSNLSSYAEQNPLLKIDPFGLRVTFVEKKWIPFLQCATRFGGGQFRHAWDILKNDDSAWEIRTAGLDQPMSLSSQAHYSTEFTSPGMGSTTNLPKFWGRPGRIWIDDRRELRCSSIVKTIVHEVIEASTVLSEPGISRPRAHQKALALDRLLTKKICASCCEISEGKMKP